jgi:GNAT superfamily N-acetyltransferase
VIAARNASLQGYGLRVHVHVRAYEPGDASPIAATLRSHDWEERYVRGQLQAVDALAHGDHGRVLVAEVDGDVIAFVSIELHEWNRLDQLHGLAVQPRSLRQGIGARLVHEAERFAEAAGYRGVYVDTPVTDEPARVFYARCGYLQDYVMSRYYDDDVDGVTYVKFFAPALPRADDLRREGAPWVYNEES